VVNPNNYIIITVSIKYSSSLPISSCLISSLPSWSCWVKDSLSASFSLAWITTSRTVHPIARLVFEFELGLTRGTHHGCTQVLILLTPTLYHWDLRDSIRERMVLGALVFILQGPGHEIVENSWIWWQQLIWSRKLSLYALIWDGDMDFKISFQAHPIVTEVPHYYTYFLHKRVHYVHRNSDVIS